MKHKRLLQGALLTGVLLGGAYQLRPNPLSAAAPPGPPPLPSAPVAEVVVRPIAPSVEVTGTIAPVREVALRARVSGFIEAVRFEEGGLVQKGQVMFLLDDGPLRAAAERARAELARATEQEALARQELERGEKLAPSGVISPSRHDGLAAAFAQARATTAAARAALRAAQLELDYTRVTSPITGRAGRALVKAGNLVSGGTDGATLLTTIVATDPVHVAFDVDEPTYLRLFRQRDVRAGLEETSLAVGLVDEDGFPHAATLEFVANALDPSTGTAEARAILSNAGGDFAPGLFARVRLATDRPRDTVFISDRAVATDQQGRYVLRVDRDGIIEQRYVRLGGTWDGLRIVDAGLSAGDRIVMGGMVRPGMKIEPRSVEMFAASGAVESRSTP